MVEKPRRGVKFFFCLYRWSTENEERSMDRIQIEERNIFSLHCAGIFLLSLITTLLRSLRNTLSIVDLGRGAYTIPCFELLGVLPAAVVMTGILARCLRRYSFQRVFLAVLGLFLLFFLLFSTCFYPLFVSWKQTTIQNSVYIDAVSHGLALLFYIGAELWKPALVNILFWGFVNQFTSLVGAKKHYASLFVGSSLGAICGGHLLVFCNTERVWRWCPWFAEQWSCALTLLISVIILAGIGAGLLFYRLGRRHGLDMPPVPSSAQHLTLGQIFCRYRHSTPLLLISLVVVADYIAYTLGEVFFLEVLKKRFPNPCAYCSYLGRLSFWGSILTVGSALLLSPILLRACRWIVPALLLPLFLLCTESLFFLLCRHSMLACHLFGWTYEGWLSVIVLWGSLQICVCRALKYTVFDATKEMAFVLLPEGERVEGKLIVDGLCARFGRGGSAVASLVCMGFCGGILGSALWVGLLALVAIGGWLWSVRRLGSLFSPHESTRVSSPQENVAN
jgi:AAA family ATP:ADP antiporter